MLKRMCTTLVLLLMAAPALAEQTIKMDLNAIYGASNFHTQGAQQFADLSKEYSGGSVLITVHSGGSLGFKGPELLKTVKDATVPMSDILMGVVAGSEEIFGLSSLPLLVKSYEDALRLYTAAKPYYEKACAKWNQKFLYAAPWPPSGLFTQKALNSMADMQGLKIRTYDKNGAEFLKQAGAGPMSLPWGEVYSALRTGLINSVLTSAVSGKDGKFWEVLKHFTMINYAYPLNMLTINMDYWNSLSPAQQEALLKAAAKTEDDQWSASKESNQAALAELEAQGMAIAQASPELQGKLDELAAAMVQDFLANANADTKAAYEAFAK